ncbi:16S rRNA (cytosine(1402)-N(4))-methyltransferase RsmH [Clostridium sp. CM028]|uniref:16S rRNA (cytosine(1402)-N(4))-methyltransferase RsmH n=1 Tax=Clostridium TaxID=1485 RepID=UPI0013EE91A8|nr:MULTISPECIES: 16S rRNA (cytosine(1402)-N(4))-methyltransferase RsmH [Clostridium]MBW9144227.1 16S rRNA (cytosine(1402)-N(4))-methyltransferase RsmH [Clostridium sp. CM027]MBW9147463.1 16S rRNA (cytosine(1402)-N(4))-methyltransferase RsmH [Clostridium sp. CM028]MBZ9608433.1 16S rRNA (cytosine(1402)-N(4))-methyltransferase RsmH [Clostridium estertheticum]UVE41135.1 16S rRNA (cytosine(1402)-N(4))-methyltransferase RsmH [Clostridium sp. CM027]WLC61802.1 16S rRNA (cytosine(1402)-N(4))-methyltran
MEFKHVSVLLNECIDALDIKEDGIYVDCTLGGAGHSLEILKRLSPKGRLIGIDQDEDALKAAKEKIKEYNNVTYVHDNFYNIGAILDKLKIEKVDGIFMDLGVSSYQLDNAERGFSYMRDANLDMRMDRSKGITAYDVVNNYEEPQIAEVLRNYGEEKFSKRIANFIVDRRKDKPINTTLELVNVIDAAIPAKFKRDGGHPAKRTFQGIRIEVNGELKILDKAIEDGIARLHRGGRMAIITFQSLEDRIVKVKFKSLEDPCKCPKELPMCVCGKTPIVKLISRKPIRATETEIEINSRSRSAKLRVAQKN